jgi:hypothetical protein
MMGGSFLHWVQIAPLLSPPSGIVQTLHPVGHAVHAGRSLASRCGPKPGSHTHDVPNSFGSELAQHGRQIRSAPALQGPASYSVAKSQIEHGRHARHGGEEHTEDIALIEPAHDLKWSCMHRLQSPGAESKQPRRSSLTGQGAQSVQTGVQAEHVSGYFAYW